MKNLNFLFSNQKYLCFASIIVTAKLLYCLNIEY